MRYIKNTLRSRRLMGSLLALLTLSGCPGNEDGGFALFSESFLSGSDLPHESLDSACFTEGGNISPSLYWKAPPELTESFALIMTETGSPNTVFWTMYDIPKANTRLLEGTGSGGAELADTSYQGINSRGTIGYDAPCPVGPGVHSYLFTLYALDVATLGLLAGASPSEIRAHMVNHILDEAALQGSHTIDP